MVISVLAVAGVVFIFCAGLASGLLIVTLVKDRVTDIAESDAAVHRVASGGTALDPEVVRQLIGS